MVFSWVPSALVKKAHSSPMRICAHTKETEQVVENDESGFVRTSGALNSTYCMTKCIGAWPPRTSVTTLNHTIINNGQMHRSATTQQHLKPRNGLIHDIQDRSKCCKMLVQCSKCVDCPNCLTEKPFNLNLMFVF